MTCCEKMFVEADRRHKQHFSLKLDPFLNGLFVAKYLKRFMFDEGPSSSSLSAVQQF